MDKVHEYNTNSQKTITISMRKKIHNIFVEGAVRVLEDWKLANNHSPSVSNLMSEVSNISKVGAISVRFKDKGLILPLLL